jgi:hypothetical protein
VEEGLWGGDGGRYGESGGDRGRENTGAGRYMSVLAERLPTTESSWYTEAWFIGVAPLDQCKLQPDPRRTNESPERREWDTSLSVFSCRSETYTVKKRKTVTQSFTHNLYFSGIKYNTEKACI